MKGGGDRFCAVFEYVGPANPRYALALAVHRQLAPPDDVFERRDDAPIEYGERVEQMRAERASSEPAHRATWTDVLTRREQEEKALIERVLTAEEPW